MDTPVSMQPANALEQRLYDLLRPYRSECFINNIASDEKAAAVQAEIKRERKVIALAQNIAFLAHTSDHNTEQFIHTKDVFIVTRGWTGEGAEAEGGVIAVLIRYPEAMNGIIKAKFEKDEDVIEILYAKVNTMLAEMM